MLRSSWALLEKSKMQCVVPEYQYYSTLVLLRTSTEHSIKVIVGRKGMERE